MKLTKLFFLLPATMGHQLVLSKNAIGYIIVDKTALYKKNSHFWQPLFPKERIFSLAPRYVLF